MTNISKIKARLEEKLRELIARAEDIEDDLSQPGDDDWNENAVESADDEVLEEVGDVTLEEIQQVKNALSRIENGKYGICVTCGDPIAKERLEALLHATRCVKCS